MSWLRDNNTRCGSDDAKIKPLDEHEWSDDFVKTVYKSPLGNFCLVKEKDDRTSITHINLDDVKAIAGSFGYKLVKL